MSISPEPSDHADLVARLARGDRRRGAFYLAKAALRDRDVARARRELQIAVEREAGPAGDAARLLRELREVSRTPLP